MVFEHKNVLIIIPTLNERENIVSCVLALRRQAPQATIAIADGGSTDGTVALAQKLGQHHQDVHFVHNPGRIQSVGINRAVEICAEPKHKIILRCDAHASYPDNYVDEILASFMAKNCASVVVPMRAIGSTGFANGASWIVDRVLGNGGAKHRGGTHSGWVDHGHHAGMRLDWFQKLGGYDPSFAHNEDAEYDHRLHAMGGRIWMNGDVQIGYFMRPSLGGLVMQYFRYGAGRARTMRKHGLRPKLRQVLPTINFALLICALVISVWWSVGVIYPMIYLMMLVLVSLIAAVHMGNVAGLWAGVAMASMHNAWALGFLLHRLVGDRS